MGTDLYEVKLKSYESLASKEALSRVVARGICIDALPKWFKKAQEPLAWIQLGLRNTYDRKTLPALCCLSAVSPPA